MKSKIHLAEVVENKDRKFGSDEKYFPAAIELEDGCEVNALFTKDQLDVAIKRAENNPEDLEAATTFWGKLFGKI